jgi:hypothetical protein
MAQAEKPFPETSWAMLGAAVDLAMKIVEADRAELLALITAARKGGNGTSGEQALLTAMRAIHVGAVAQVDLADAAIAVIQRCTGAVDETALAALDSSSATQ